MSMMYLFPLFVLLTYCNAINAQRIGVGAKPTPKAKLYMDGTARSLHKNWTYWSGPRLSASLPLKWPVVANPNGTGTVVSSNDPAAAGGLYGAADLVTKDEFKDCRIHVEFLINNEGGNSGIYLQNRFEIQVLDGDSSAHGMAAIINERRAPYHLYRGKGDWNAYDIVFRAARFRNGQMVEQPMLTLHFNGKKVHLNRNINQVWGGPNSGIDGGNNDGKGLTDTPGGLKLQAEGHQVLYRNIWIEALELQQSNTDILEPGVPELPTPDTEARLERVSFTSALDGTQRQYFLYLPKNFDGVVHKRYPVLMFLHGNGERGNGLDELDYVITHGPLYEAWIQKRDLPFIIISPQLPMFGMDKKGFSYIDNRTPASIPKRMATATPPRNNGYPMPEAMTGVLPVDTFPGGIKTLPVGWDMIETDLKMMLDHAHQHLNGDRERTYLTGLSYGGFGTWHFASTHPQYFAAIAPVVGWGHPDYMAPIATAKIPVWAFAGGLDPVIPARYFYAGINRLKALGCPDLRFTIHEDMGHDAWLRVYGGQDLYDWLLSKRK
jgi:pimeloyl-ACP methyl ester carboxylesterase